MRELEKNGICDIKADEEIAPKYTFFRKYYLYIGLSCVGGNSILGACILHMQAGPAYACIPYLTHNKLM